MSDFKRCIVPSCDNTSLNSKKIFIFVPRSARRQWSLAVGRKKLLSATSGSFHCCEDHFDMENDVENWMAFKLFSQKIQMKKGVVPHKNLNIDVSIPKQISQLTDSARKLKYQNIAQYTLKTLYSHVSKFEECHTEQADPSTSTKLHPQAPLHSTVSVIKSPSGNFVRETIYIEDPYFDTEEEPFSNEEIQVDINGCTTTAGTSTVLLQSTSPFELETSEDTYLHHQLSSSLTSNSSALNEIHLVEVDPSCLPEVLMAEHFLAVPLLRLLT